MTEMLALVFSSLDVSQAGDADTPCAEPYPRKVDAARCHHLRSLVDTRLSELIKAGPQTPQLLETALRYALLAPGKRVRPLLALLAAEHFGGAAADALDFACAVEMVHTASLILDDLPSMDDALLRRSRRTLHVAFGEDIAILAAIALLAQAFNAIACSKQLGAVQRVKLMAALSEAVGSNGLVGGQVRDLHDDASLRSMDGLNSLNHQKTGVLFVTAVEGGAAAAGATEIQIVSARAFAQSFGLAFQLQDDLLDVISTAEMLGKDIGKDGAKRTSTTVLGIAASKAAVSGRLMDALAQIVDGPLKDFTLRFFVQMKAAPIS